MALPPFLTGTAKRIFDVSKTPVVDKSKISPVFKAPETPTTATQRLKDMITKPQEIDVKGAVKTIFPSAAPIIDAVPIKNPQTKGGILGTVSRNVVAPIFRFVGRTEAEFSKEGNKARRGGTPAPIFPIKNEIAKSLLGEEPITTLSSGPVASTAADMLKTLGISNEKAKLAGLFPSILFGAITENPFGVNIEKKTAKNLLEKTGEEFGPEITKTFKQLIEEGMSAGKIKKVDQAGALKRISELNTAGEVRAKLIDSALNSSELSDNTKAAIAKLDASRDIISNKETYQKANDIINADLNKALDIVKDPKKTDEVSSAVALELIRKANAEGRASDAADLLDILSKKATSAGREVQIFRTLQQFSPEGMQYWAQKEFAKANEPKRFVDKAYNKLFKRSPVEFTPEDASFISNGMKKVQSLPEGPEKDAAMKEVLGYVNDRIPLNASEVLDAFRYQNMLSGPRTQERNIFANMFQTFVTRPATLLAEVPIDFVQSKLTGKARENYLRDVPTYAKGVLNSFDSAIEAFKGAWNNNLPLSATTNPDLRTLRQSKLPKSLTVVSRLMEGADQFFQALIGGGEYSRMISNGVAENVAKEEATKVAQYSLLRKPLDVANTTGQGYVLSAFDKATQALMDTKKKWPGMSWFVPFITTPMNFAKQTIEHSPLGLTTLLGSTQKKSQVAKVMLGSMVTMIGAQKAFGGETTWSAPTNPEDKKLFYATKKPYSVKIGDQWVPFTYFGPFALALALPAALKYQTQDQGHALTDSGYKKLTKSLSSILEFYSNQTFLEGVNNYIGMMSGTGQYNLPNSLAFTTSQAIPASGLIRYVNQFFIDPVYRDAKTYTESLQKDIPGLSKKLPAKLGPNNEEQRRQVINSLIPYDVTKHAPVYSELLDKRMQATREKDLLSKQESERLTGIIQKLQSIPPEKRVGYYNTLDKETKAKAAKAIKKPDAPEVNFYRSLEVGNGMRAKYLFDAISKMPKEQRPAFISNMKKEKILTKEVLKQLSDLMKEPR